MTHIGPDQSQLAAFQALPADTPINMLNLIRFRDRAAYSGDAPEGIATGEEAYAAYTRGVMPLLKAVGGSMLWQADPKLMLIGPKDEAWDLSFVIRYPSAAKFLEMINSDAYKEVLKHRIAAVADSRLLRCDEAAG